MRAGSRGSQRKESAAPADGSEKEEDPLGGINPLGTDITATEEMLGAGPTPTEEPKFNQTSLPDNPTKADEVSPKDPMETVDNHASAVADAIEPVPAGMPSLFEGETDRGVCVACMVSAFDFGETETCGCRAKCLVGADDTACNADSVGHSNEDVSVPEQFWEARCNEGTKSCSDDVLSFSEKAAVQKEIKDCRNPPSGETRQTCFAKITKRWSGIQQTYYCTQRHLMNCAVFNKDVSGTHDQWECYTSMKFCQQSKLSSSSLSTSNTKPTHCVWCGVMR